MDGWQRLKSLLRPTGWKTALAYAALAAFFTWPLIIHPAHWVFFGIDDTRPHLWNEWWIRRCLLSGAGPFHTNLLFYPMGTSLALTSIAYPYCLLSAPFQSLFALPNGLTIGMTFTIFFSFVATGLGTYLLARDLTGSRSAAFVAGIAAAFTAYRVWHLGRMNVLGLEGIPVSLWLLFRALRGDQARARDGVALGLAAAYTFYTDVTYTVYLAGVGGLILAYHLAFERDRIWHPRCGWALAIGGCTALAVSAPLLSAMIPELRHNPIAVRSLEETKYFSADLAGFFLPSHLHPVWGKWVAPLYERAPQIKGYETYLGYTLLAFAIVAVVKRRRLDRKRVVFWAALAAASALLALGPTLHWLGRETAVPLPYRWLWYAAPILRVSRTPVRLVVITNLSLAVLLAYAIVFIRAHARPGLAAMMPAAAAVLLLAETICVPLPTNRLDIPRFYWERAKDADSYAILEAPLLDESLKRWAMTAQVVHHKPILYADPPRPSRHALDFIHANEAILGPLVGLRLAPNGGVYLLPGEPAALRPLLVRSRIRYVVVHPHAAAGPGVAALEVDFLRAAGLEEVWAEAELVAFRAY